MNLRKFFSMTREEKNKALCRRTYGLLHKRKFGDLGKNSFIWKPLLITNCKYMFIGTECSVYPAARIECITDWVGGQTFFV